jgi:hypothetical protein
MASAVRHIRDVASNDMMFITSFMKICQPVQLLKETNGNDEHHKLSFLNTCTVKDADNKVERFIDACM